MKGIAVSKGVAIGKAYLLDSSKFCIIKHQLNELEAEKEIVRFREAIEKTKLQMTEIKKRAKKVSDKYAVILETYSLLLDDDILYPDIQNYSLTHLVPGVDGRRLEIGLRHRF